MSREPLPVVTPEDAGVRFRPLPVAIVALAAVLAGLAPVPLPAAAHATLVVLIAVGGLWVTEAVPVAAAALLVPVLGVVLGITDAKGAFAGFGDPIVFLFFGAFLLTEAAALHGLQSRLAQAVLGSRAIRERPGRLLGAVALLGGGLSAWMNNTATTALLIPLALTAERFAAPPLLSSVMLATSWAPSIGGIATPVGSAPNLIGLRLIEQATGARPSFAGWCAMFAPLAVIAITLATLWLRLRAGRDASPPPLDARLIPAARGPWTRAERTLLPMCLAVVLAWIAPGILAATPFAGEAWVKAWQSRVPEPVVPLLGGLLLFMLPAGAGRQRILDANVFRRLDWSTILLLGGGISLGNFMAQSGLARALGDGLFHALPVGGTFGIVLVATLMAVIVSELTSNTASVALVVPVVLALAEVAGVPPLKPALAATIACSFGFMLPVSTPPNALVYATGRVPMRAMILNGIMLDVLGVVLVSLWATWFV